MLEYIDLTDLQDVEESSLAFPIGGLGCPGALCGAGCAGLACGGGAIGLFCGGFC